MLGATSIINSTYYKYCTTTTTTVVLNYCISSCQWVSYLSKYPEIK